MALRARSMFLYGFEVRTDNQNIPFRATFGGLQLNGVVPLGFYSLTGLMSAIAAAMHTADPAHNYTVTADRSVSGGTENRVTIATGGTYLDLLFATGTLADSSIRDLLAYGIFDYSGSTSYQNSATSGTALTTEWFAYNYQPPEVYAKNFGAVNVSASGLKETITWTIQRFIECDFRYEAEAKVLVDWRPFINWMIQQKLFDFTPEITSPNTVHEVTLEKSTEDGKGLGFKMREMIPDFPFRYTTGPMTFRLTEVG